MNFTIEKISEFEQNSEYNQIIEQIYYKINNSSWRDFVPSMSLILNIDEDMRKLLEKLYEIILPLFEEKIYNKKVSIIDEKILRHMNEIEHKKEGSFLWHIDNHPEDILNIIIYLSDVGKNDGAFQYASLEKNIIKFPYLPPSGGIIKEDFVRQNKNIIIEQVEGKKGTIFIFDNCILHRASHPTENYRDALLLQIK